MNQYSAINNKSPPWSVGNCSGKTWMKDLECLNNVSLSDIILPGSHDAGAFKLYSTEISPIAPEINTCLFKYCCCCVVQNFAIAQTGTLYDQLCCGSRYLDLRVTYDMKKRILRTEHSLYGLPLLTLFQQIAKFIKENPSEIVILHLRHFSILKYYDMEMKHHEKIILLLKDIFDVEHDFIESSEISLPVNELKKRNRKILLVYGIRENNISCNNAIRSMPWIHIETKILPGGIGWTKSTTAEHMVSQWKLFASNNNKQTPSLSNNNNNNKHFYKVATAITPNPTVITNGVLNCIFCCLCRIVCKTSCRKPAGLKEVSDIASDAIIEEIQTLVDNNIRLNILDIDHVVRQQKRINLIEKIILLNKKQCGKDDYRVVDVIDEDGVMMVVDNDRIGNAK